MITLIASFLTFLMTLNVPSKTECQNRLKELNYTYEYNQEPSRQNARDNLYFSRMGVLDTLSHELQKEISSTYSCFRQALAADTNLVILMTKNPRATPVFRSELLFSEDKEWNYERRVPTGRLVKYHHLKDYNVYSTIDTTQNQLIKIELLNQNDNKLKNENVTLYKEEICKNCPF